MNWLRKPLIGVLCFALVKTSVAVGAEPTTSPAQAVMTIQQATNDSSPGLGNVDELINANVAIGLIDKPREFKDFVEKNQDQLIQQANSTNKQQNKEITLLASYIVFQAQSGRDAVVQFLFKALSNPYVQTIGGDVWGFLKAAFGWFVNTITLTISVVVLGKMIDSWTKPVTEPFNQKASTNGNNLLGPIKKWLMRKLYREKTPEEIKEEIQKTRVELENLRRGIMGSRVSLSLEQLLQNLGHIKDYWIVQKVAQDNLSADQKDGRNLFYDAVSARVMTNANSAVLSMQAADTSLQGALSMIETIRGKTATGSETFKEAGRIGYVELPEAMMRLTQAERLNQENVEPLRYEVEQLQARLARIAATGDDPKVAEIQAARVVAQLQDHFHFVRTAAASLAHGKLHDIQFSDIIAPVLHLYEKARAAFGIDYLNSIMADAVVEELNQIGFVCDVAEAAATEEVALGWRLNKTQGSSKAAATEDLVKSLTQVNGGSAALPTTEAAEERAPEIRFKPVARPTALRPVAP